jgi:hypothetical protein
LLERSEMLHVSRSGSGRFAEFAVCGGCIIAGATRAAQWCPDLVHTPSAITSSGTASAHLPGFLHTVLLFIGAQLFVS